MVQAEVAERLARRPGRRRRTGCRRSRRPGGPTVRRAGAVPRAVFWPVPNVDSGLVAFEPARAAGVGRGPGRRLRMCRRGVRPAPQDPAGRAGRAGRVSAHAAERALRAAGHRPAHARRAARRRAVRRARRRARRAAPRARRGRRGRGVSAGVTVRAPAKVNLLLAVGPPRPDGYHDLATVFHAVSLYDEVTATPAEPTTRARGDGRRRGARRGRRPAGRAQPGRPRRPAARRAAPAARAACTCTSARASRSPAAWPAAAPTRRPPCVACDALWADRARPRRAARARRRAGPRRAVRAARRHGARHRPGRPADARRWPAATTTGWSRSPTAGCRRRRSTRELRPAARAAGVLPEPRVPDALMQALRRGDPARGRRAAGQRPAAGRGLAAARAASARSTVGSEYGALGGVVSGSGPTVAFLAARRPSTRSTSSVALTASGACRDGAARQRAGARRPRRRRARRGRLS